MVQFIDLDKGINTTQYLQMVSDEIIAMGYKATTNNLIQILRLYQREIIRNKKGRFLTDFETEALIIREILSVLRKNIITESSDTRESKPSNSLSDIIRIAIINQKIAETTCNNIKRVLQKYQ